MARTAASTARTMHTPTPTQQPDLLATATVADPAGLAVAVATLASRTAEILQASLVTPAPR